MPDPWRERTEVVAGEFHWPAAGLTTAALPGQPLPRPALVRQPDGGYPETVIG